MKKMILLASSFAAISVAQATTELTERHQNKIAAEIQITCGGNLDKTLRVLSHKVELTKVDQGVIDQYHTLKIEVLDESKKYIVDVESIVFDAYDHDDQDWGLISVESVEGCQ